MLPCNNCSLISVVSKNPKALKIVAYSHPLSFDTPHLTETKDLGQHFENIISHRVGMMVRTIARYW